VTFKQPALWHTSRLGNTYSKIEMHQPETNAETSDSSSFILKVTHFRTP